MRSCNASSKPGTTWPNSSTVRLVISRNFSSLWLTSAYLNPLIDSLLGLVFPQYTINRNKVYSIDEEAERCTDGWINVQELVLPSQQADVVLRTPEATDGSVRSRTCWCHWNQHRSRNSLSNWQTESS